MDQQGGFKRRFIFPTPHSCGFWGAFVPPNPMIIMYTLRCNLQAWNQQHMRGSKKKPLLWGDKTPLGPLLTTAQIFLMSLLSHKIHSAAMRLQVLTAIILLIKTGHNYVDLGFFLQNLCNDQRGGFYPPHLYAASPMQIMYTLRCNLVAWSKLSKNPLLWGGGKNPPQPLHKFFQYWLDRVITQLLNRHR